MDDLAALRALAEKATPGPWYAYHPYREDECESVISTKPKDDPDEYSGRIMNNGDFAASCATLYDENANFIAAANPAVILALLNRIARVEALCDEKERYEQAWADEQTRTGAFGKDDEGENVVVTVTPTLLIKDVRASLGIEKGPGG